MFILGAMGIPVVKHGNRGITKRTGSADVLEAMGIKIDLAPEEVPRCLKKLAARFSSRPVIIRPSRFVAPVRRALAAEGQRTVFNLLGPCSIRRGRMCDSSAFSRRSTLRSIKARSSS